jgi:cytochrome P450
MVRFTLRLVGNGLFGKKMRDEELEALGRAISTIQGFIVRQIVQPYMIPWFRISGQSERYQRIRAAADRIVSDYVEARKLERSGDVDADILEYMLSSPSADGGPAMSTEQILIEILQLLVAGNETSSTSLSWTMYLLARHPEVARAMRDEIRGAFTGGPIGFDALHRLPYTLQVLDEATRLYPAFWMIDRTAVADDEIQGIHIPAGITVVPYIYGTHRNPAHWSDPEAFDPGRFSREATKQRHPFAHIPFGGGPRVCVGANMAMMQMLLILVSIVRDYDFALATPGPVDIDPMMILRPKGTMDMTFERIRP